MTGRISAGRCARTLLYYSRSKNPAQAGASASRVILREAPAPLKPTIETHIAIIKPATEFARHARHNSIAHRNFDVALGITPLQLGSRNDIRGALKTIDDLLHAIEHHYLQTSPTNYDYLDTLGGVDSLLDIVERGLKSRNAQFGYFRSPHPPDPS
jgi:hypothetical protein